MWPGWRCVQWLGRPVRESHGQAQVRRVIDGSHVFVDGDFTYARPSTGFGHVALGHFDGQGHGGAARNFRAFVIQGRELHRQ